MRNKILKPLAIASLLAVVPLTISSAYAVSKVNSRPSAFKLLNICGTAKNLPCKVGEIGPGGGIIFYVDNQSQYPFGYLEAAPSNLRPLASNWCKFSNLIGTTSGVLNTGKVDSALVLQGCLSDVSSATSLATIPFTAAQLASAPNSSATWYLPSISELQLIKINAAVQVGWKKSAAPIYWSSTEVAPTLADPSLAPTAWAMNSLDGSTSPALKTDILEILPIRSFGD